MIEIAEQQSVQAGKGECGFRLDADDRPHLGARDHRRGMTEQGRLADAGTAGQHERRAEAVAGRRPTAALERPRVRGDGRNMVGADRGTAALLLENDWAPRRMRTPLRSVQAAPMSNGDAPSALPDTIVLVHGFWVTPRSWEHWITHYEQRGFKVLAPAYPGYEAEVEALNADPTVIAEATVPAIIGHFEEVIGALDSPPILIGHSAGGAFVQVLLDHGFGAAGVALNSAPTEGVKVIPLSQVKATFPVLKNPANRHRAVPMDLDQWHYAFTNTFTQEESDALHERYAIPASGGIFWDSVLANLTPGHQEVWVDYKNDDRAPLLFVSGGEDKLMPPKVQRSNAKHYKSKQDRHRGQALRGIRPPAAGPGGLGGDRRLRARLGARPAQRRAGDCRSGHRRPRRRVDRRLQRTRHGE